MLEEHQLIISNIAKGLEKIIENTECEIIKTFPSEFFNDFFNGVKYKITHEFDPEWDCSGKLILCEEKSNFNIEDYGTVWEFFEEYTGNSEPTFISGFGMHHETYDDVYSHWVEKELEDTHHHYLKSMGFQLLLNLAKEAMGETYIKNYTIDNIDQLIFDLCEDIEEFDDNYWLKAGEILEVVKQMDIMLVYKQGEKDVKEQLLNELTSIEINER